MMKDKNNESRVLVGVGEPMTGFDTKTVLFGMTPAAWEALTGGRTHDFDLTKIGIPVKILIFRGETHAEVADIMRAGAEATGASFADQRRPLTNLGIDKPVEH